MDSSSRALLQFCQMRSAVPVSRRLAHVGLAAQFLTMLATYATCVPYLQHYEHPPPSAMRLFLTSLGLGAVAFLAGLWSTIRSGRVAWVWLPLVAVVLFVITYPAALFFATMH